jgi:hypothetical protein
MALRDMVGHAWRLVVVSRFAVLRALPVRAHVSTSEEAQGTKLNRLAY